MFICIAAGLGYGANQTVATTVAVVLILVFISIIKFRKAKITEKNIYLTIETNDKIDIKSSDLSKSINKILKDENGNYDLKRLDITEDIFQATYILNLKDLDTLDNIVKVLQSKHPKIKINFIDQNQVPSI